jgi:phosphate transport system substrate-binding protein
MFSRIRFAVLSILLAVGSVTLARVGSAETLNLGGSGGAVPMMRQVGATFATRTATDLKIFDSLGSGGGITAAGDGVLDVTISGRPLTQKEVAAGFSAPLILRTPYVLATSYQAPPSISRSEVSRLFADAKASWPDGTPVRIILRPTTESDNAVLFALFPGTEEAVTRARQRSDVPIAPTDQDNQEMATHTPGSLIGTTFTQTLLEARGLGMLPVDGVMPSGENLASGSYPYEKRLWLVQPPRKTEIGQKFIVFLSSPEGQQALKKAGILPLPE